MKDEASRLAALRSGKVDYIGANAASNINTPDAVEGIERTNPDLKIWPYYFRSNAGMTYNLTNPPYSDIRVRKACRWPWISRLSTTRTIRIGRGDPARGHGEFPNPITIHFDQWPEEIKAGYRYDPEAAERLLDEAGYPRDENGIRFTAAMDGLSCCLNPRLLRNRQRLLARDRRRIGVSHPRTRHLGSAG